jgi:hypothetical protein
MPVVQFGNIYYFFYIALFLLIIFLSLHFLKNKSDTFRKWFIFGLVMLNLLIHFLKILIYPYTTVDYPLTKITFENVCAVSVLTFPVLFFVKSKTLKDYMIMAGMASGFIAVIFPVDVMVETFNGAYLGYKHAFSLESMRFYTTHFLIFLAPFLMMRYKMHRLSIKRALRAPFLLFSVLILIFINEWILTSIGWVPKEQFLSTEHRNPSFIFGSRSDLEGLGIMIGAFVPAFMLVHPITLEPQYWPVLWLIFPVFVYGTFISLTFMMIYDRSETLKSIKNIFKIPRKNQYGG